MADHWTEKPAAKVLIELFIANSIEQLYADDAARICQRFGVPRERYPELLAREDYKLAYRRLYSMRERVEQISVQAQDLRSRLGLSLALLKLYRRDNKFIEQKICRRMLETAFVPNWPADLQKEFAEAADVLEFVDYFLSYTNKRAAEINIRFQAAFLPAGRVAANDPKTAFNLVARDFAEQLRTNNLKGYFDVREIEIGDGLRDDLIKGARHAMVFIQLVEQVMLMEPDEGETNWCHLEFCTYGSRGEPARKADLRKLKYAFLMTAKGEKGEAPTEAVRPAVLPEAYQPWFGEMVEDRVEVLYSDDPGGLYKQINKVAKVVKNFRDETLNWVVNEEFVYEAGI